MTVGQASQEARFDARRADHRLGPVAAAAALQGLGAGAIVFGGGLPDPATHPVEALGRHLAAVLHDQPVPALTYDSGLGVPALRRAVAAHLTARDGIAFEEDQICITAGSSGAIALAAVSFLEPGDVVLVEEITYPQALKAFGHAGVRAVPCPVDGDGVLLEGLTRALRRQQDAGHRVRAVYLGANFGIPLNGWLPRDRREALARLAEEHELLLLQDDTYGGIRFLDDMPPSLAAMAPGLAVELGSFSKTIAPGIRLGWAATSAPLAAVMAGTRTDLGVSPLLQLAVARFLSSGEFDAHLRTVRAHYRSKRDALAEALAVSCAGRASWSVPDGGFCIWLTLGDWTADELTPVAHRHGVAYLPQSYFSATGADGPRLRLAYGERTVDELVEGARRLGAAVRDPC